MLGFSLERYHDMLDAIVRGFDPAPATPDAPMRAFEEVAEYGRELIAQKRHDPADDLISMFIAAREGGDKLDEDEVSGHSRWGVFGTTLVAFFLAEMGDKTQIATVMLAAKYNAYLWVVAGTTLGMMLANAPVVWLGDKLVKRVPIRLVHVVSAVIFLVLGVLALFLPGTGVLA